MVKTSTFLISMIFISSMLLVAINSDMLGFVTATGAINITINKVVPQAVCGNGTVESGEDCESNSHCSSGQICVSCQCKQSVQPSGGGAPRPRPAEEEPGEEAPEEEIEEEFEEKIVIEINVEEEATTEEKSRVFEELKLNSFEGIAKIDLADRITEVTEKIKVIERIRIVEKVEEGGEKSYESVFEAEIKHKGDENVARLLLSGEEMETPDLLLVHLIPETVFEDLTQIKSEKEFAIIGREMIAFQISGLSKGETEVIVFSIPKKIEGEEVKLIKKLLLMIEKLDLTNACLVLNCDDSNPCTIDACSRGACIHSNAENGTACEDGKVCLGGRCVKEITHLTLFIPGEEEEAISWRWLPNLSLLLLLASALALLSLERGLIYFERRHKERVKGEIKAVEESFADGRMAEKDFVALIKGLVKKKKGRAGKVREKIFGKEI